MRHKVSCTVSFYEDEVAQLKEGEATFNLKCEIWGDDLFFDDYLFPMGYKLFGKNVSLTNKVNFTQSVSRSDLNEDGGQEEIYAKLKLSRPPWQITAKKTNVVVL